MLEYQEQEKRNTELRVKLLEVQENLTVREHENSKLECRVKGLSGKSREDAHVSVGTRVDLRVRGFQKQGSIEQACWRRQQPALDQEAARVQDGFADGA